jgi:hypothetical protein
LRSLGRYTVVFSMKGWYERYYFAAPGLSLDPPMDLVLIGVSE